MFVIRLIHLYGKVACRLNSFDSMFSSILLILIYINYLLREKPFCEEYTLYQKSTLRAGCKISVVKKLRINMHSVFKRSSYRQSSFGIL